MRKTTHSTSHSLTAAGHEAPGRSVAPARVQPRFPNHEGLSHGPGLQTGYDFGRIPIFSRSPENRQSMSVLTTPTEHVELEAERMARNVLHRLTGVSPQREGQGRGGMAPTSDFSMSMTSG